MATQIIYDVKINTGQGAQGLASLNDTVNALNSNLANLKQRQADMTTALSKMRTGTLEYDALFKEIKKVDAEIKKTSQDQVAAYSDLNKALKAPLKTMRDLETAQSLINEELKGVEIGSQEYKDLAAQLRIVNTELKNQELAMEVLDNEQLGASVKGLAGGLTDIAGGLTLIGLQGESVEKIAQTFAQIEGLSKIVGGAFDVWNEGLKLVKAGQTAAAAATATLTASQTANAAATGVATAATQTQANATKAAGIQQRILNAIMNANPVFLLITGVAALVGAFVALNAIVGKTDAAQEAYNATQEDYKKGAQDAIKETTDVKVAFDLARKGVISKEEALKTYNDTLGDAFGKTNDLNEAEKIFNDKTAAYIKAAGLRAQANALLQISAEKYAEGVTAGFEDQTSFSAKFYAVIDLTLGNTEEAFKKLAKSQVEGSKEVQKEKKKESDAITKIAEDLLLQANQIENANGIISDSEQALLDELEAKRKEAERAAEAARQKRIDNSKSLAAELKKLQESEEIDLAGSEDRKNEILKNREQVRLTQIYLLSEKTVEDKKNLDAALLKLDEKYLRDKQAKVDKANEDAKNAAIKAAQDNQNAEYGELEEGAERVRRLFQSEQQNEIDDINDYYFRLIQLKKKNGEDTTATELAQNIEIAKVRDKYRKEEEDKDKETKEKQKQANEEALASYKDTLLQVSDIVSAAFAQDFDAINEGFNNLNTLLLDPEDGLIKKLTEGTLGAVSAIGDAVMLATDILSQFSQKKLEDQLASSQELYDQQNEQVTEALANREISQSEYDAKVKILEQQKRERDRKADQDAFARSKKLALVQATIATAQAVLQAFQSGAAYPFIGPATGAIFAGIAGALGAVQIATIASQQYRAARGGIVPGSASPDFDSVPALLAPGETVINSRSSAMYPELLSEINRSGGGVPLTPTAGKSNSGGMNEAQVTTYNNNQIVEAVVSEQTITATQTTVDRQKRRQRFLR